MSVRQIGTWSLVMKSSYFSPDKQTLNPPHTSVNYSSEFDNKFDFKELLVESGCETQMAVDLEKWLIHDKMECTEGGKPFVLFGLGKIENDSFSPDDELIFDKFAGWTKVASPYIPQKKESLNHQEDYLFRLNNPYLEKKDKNRYSQYYGPILLGLFLLVFIMFWFLKPTSVNHEKSKPTSAVIAENLPEVSPDNVMTQDSAFETKEFYEIPENNTLEKNKDEETAKSIEETVTYTECVLIVGSFKYSRNSKRMIETLQKDGYQTYTEIHNGFKRVGLIYDCQAQHPDSFKEEMRNEAFPGAWNLHDTL